MRVAISPKPEKATREVGFVCRRNQPRLKQTKRVESYIFYFTGRGFDSRRFHKTARNVGF